MEFRYWQENISLLGVGVYTLYTKPNCSSEFKIRGVCDIGDLHPVTEKSLKKFLIAIVDPETSHFEIALGLVKMPEWIRTKPKIKILIFHNPIQAVETIIYGKRLITNDYCEFTKIL